MTFSPWLMAPEGHSRAHFLQVSQKAVTPKPIGKARVGWLRVGAWLKTQLGFDFAPRKEVQHPGSRGGRFRWTPKGKVRYDQPTARMVMSPGRAATLEIGRAHV